MERTFTQVLDVQASIAIPIQANVTIVNWASTIAIAVARTITAGSVKTTEASMPGRVRRTVVVQVATVRMVSVLRLVLMER